MQNVSTLTVGLGDRAYDIVIGPDLLAQTGDILGSIAAGRHIVPSPRHEYGDRNSGLTEIYLHF